MTPAADVLVIFAHPDDAEFGVAGTVASWTGEGKRVVYAACTSGEKGTSDLSVRPEELGRRREDEQRDAAAVLGVAEVVFLRYPDQGLEDTPELRKDLVRVIRAHRPEIVATMDPYRRYLWHRDHRVVGQVVMDAVFPFARDHLAYPDLLVEGLGPHKVKEVWCFATENPNHRVDVTATFDRKIQALRCHRSQMKDAITWDPEARTRERCREMAQGTGFELAEAFYRAIAPP